MFKLFSELLSPVLFSPEAPPAAGGSIGQPASDMSKEDVIDFLGEDDDKTETIPLTDEKPSKGKDKTKPDEDDDKKLDTKTQEEEEPEEQEEEDELKELEEELKEPTEEQLELVTPVRRRDILKKYPQLFKDFPYLEKAYYREQQFTEILPTIEDAKIAVDKATTLDQFDEDLKRGNTEVVLRAIKQTNPQVFNKVVDDYLNVLANVDEQAHLHVIGTITKHTIVSMVQEAKRSDNAALLQAAQILNQYVFGSSNYTPPEKLSKGENPQQNAQLNEVQRQQQQFFQQRYETARGDLNTRVNNTLRATIAANIDPKNSMTDYVKKTATRDATETLESLIGKDTRFKALVDKLWEAAFKANFSKDSVDRIKSAFTSKAKTLLPSVIKKARNEALRGTSGRKVSDEDDSSDDKKGPVKESGGRSQSHRESGKSKSVPEGMSTLDFLNSD